MGRLDPHDALARVSMPTSSTEVQRHSTVLTARPSPVGQSRGIGVRPTQAGLCERLSYGLLVVAKAKVGGVAMTDSRGCVHEFMS